MTGLKEGKKKLVQTQQKTKKKKKKYCKYICKIIGKKKGIYEKGFK